MKTFVAAIVGTTLFERSLSIECGTNSIGIDWAGASASDSSSSSSSASWQSAYSTDECTEDVCTVASYDLDFTLTVNDFLGFSWWDFTWDGSLSVDGAFCGETDLCTVFAGGTSDSCNAVNFEFQQWYPTTCNANADYNAATIDYNITYKYGCCDTDLCNEDFDWSICSFNANFGGYVSDLYECWNGVKEDYMKYLYCDDDGNDMFEWEKGCKSSGQWTGYTSNDNCTLILTCTNDIQLILENFGECACTAATDNGYSGAFIAEVMETQWNTYCPGIELSCGVDDATLALYITYWYVYWTFYYDIDFNELTDDLKEQIRNAIANAANVDASLVVIITIDDGDTTDGRRRLQDTSSSTGTTISVQIQTETSDDASMVEDEINLNGDSTVSTQTGYSASGNSTSISDESVEVDPDGAEMMVLSTVGSLIVAISLVNAIF